jgi:hypothetical protein
MSVTGRVRGGTNSPLVILGRDEVASFDAQLRI